MNFQVYDVFVKLGYWIDNDQNLEFEVNCYNVKGKQDYVSVDGDWDNGVLIMLEKGELIGQVLCNQVLIIMLKYQYDDLYGIIFNVQVYNQ